MFGLFVEKVKQGMRKFLIFLIKVYQLVLSPLLGNRCRFHPSCSNYALVAVEQHGIFKGMGLILWRLLRCHPLCTGGFDPVPNPRK